MSDQNDYFSKNPTLDNSQGSIDPFSQGSIDPENKVHQPEVMEESFFKSEEQTPYVNQNYSGMQPGNTGQSQGMNPYVNSGNYMQPNQPQYYPGMGQPPKKKKTGLIIGIVAAAVILIVGIAAFAIVYHNNQEKIAADQEKAQEVTNLIAMIGEVSLGSDDAITDARSAYDALTEDQQEYVSNLAELTSAEKKYEKLEEEEEARLEAEREAEAAKEAAAAAAKAAAKEAAKNNPSTSNLGSSEYMVSGTKNYLAIRSQPSSSSTVEIGKTYNGNIVEVIEKTNGTFWYVYDYYTGLYGYVKCAYLKK